MIERDQDMPICDSCAIDNTELHLRFDWGSDLFLFLQEEVPKDRICNSCFLKTLTLIEIESEDPIIGSMHCKNCNRIDELEIYIVDS